MAMEDNPSWFIVSSAASPLDRDLEMPGGGLIYEMAVASFVRSA